MNLKSQIPNLKSQIPILTFVACLALALPARAQSVTASSVHAGDYPAAAAFDGDAQSRWASRAAGTQWLQVDLGKPGHLDGLTLHWENAYAAEYQVQVSPDGRTWQTVHHQRAGKGGREAIPNLNADGRYFRILCLKAGPHALYSLYEVELRGPAADALAEARRAAAERGRAALRDRLAQSGLTEIVFAARHLGDDGHWYANFAYYARQTERKCYGAPGGKLCRLDLRTGKLTTLINDPDGAIRDPQVHYDAKRIVFSWRKGGSDHYNLYEIDADGTNLRQLTRGDWDDIEPCYLPDGGIVFCSSRAKRWVNCWLTQVAVLYRCDADGANLRPLSSNNEQDNTPWVLPDGRILYQRWEYVDRSQVDYHHLWTANPDGTYQTVYFGNMRPGILMIDAKPIPGTSKVLATFSPGHGQREHEGPFYVVNPDAGPDAPDQAVKVGPRAGRDPFPVGPGHVLYAAGRSIRLADYAGQDVELFADPKLELHEPRPLVARPREPVISPRTDPTKATGRLILADVKNGRNLDGVKPGEVTKLLVMETLPKPINFTGGMDPLTYGGSFTLERVVGTVPVEPDGSAYVELPALRSFFFIALDAQDNSVKRMQSFLTVQPGEVTSCTGCHENRSRVVPTAPSPNLMALRRPPSTPQPIADIPDVLDFPRDVQPVLDRHCVACHDYTPAPARTQDSALRTQDSGPRAGGVILTGDRGPMFSHSYYTLTVRRQFADGRNEPRGNRPPRSIGASASPLMKKLDGSHYGAKPSAHEVKLVRYWIEAGAPYPGTYAALGTGMIGGYYENNQVETDFKWPQSLAAGEAMKARCTSCHNSKDLSLPRALSDENDVSFWRPDWNDPRLHRARHLLFNLSRPEMSLALLAPLAKEAGGFARCTTKDGKPVFASKDDADYAKILAMCAAGKVRLDALKRFDMPGFRPDPAYVREMTRYGVLAPTFDLAKDPIDLYATDQAYWRSLWWTPTPAPLTGATR